ncbi:type IV secretory system conjugative DNA transfer family protein [Candidatus Saccharibacteria bacterium]|nr:type IV secretory system conjugative DNA transfer family protein [Candidatus Saccharibacteria bacterium]
MSFWVALILLLAIIAGVIMYVVKNLNHKRKLKDYERQLKLVPLLIHLPPSTDDIEVGGRDERDVNEEAISAATVMYSIIASTLKKKGFDTKLYGQRYFSFDIITVGKFVKYYAVVPAVLEETVKQAIVSSYPTARLEEGDQEVIFQDGMTAEVIAGGEFELKKEYVYPITTYEDSKWDAQTAILNAMTKVKDGEGMAVQVLFRPAQPGWVKIAEQKVSDIKDNKKSWNGSNLPTRILHLFLDVIKAPFEVPDEHKYDDGENKPLSQPKQEEIQAIENKAKYPGFEVLIRVIAATSSKQRSEALVGGIVASFSQFDSQTFNGFKYNLNKKSEQLASDYIFHNFPRSNKNCILNSVELASIFHLPSQNSIPSSGVERQQTKQVDGPAKLMDDGVILGVNEYRGEKKEIRLGQKDRRRHTYVIGATGMGKSVFLKNIAYQDMMDGRGFAFIDPHGDVTEELLSMVPPDRIDDVIYFDPSDLENPIGMNMFEWQTEDQKDFIVQEGINMLYSLYDPGHTGIFGPRGEQMFRNAAILLMSDPKGATFIDIPKCFIDPEFVKSKLKYVTDKNVYDYWTKEFPASQKSNDAGEVVTWFNSKWSPFISNRMMKCVLGQIKSGFNIREVMDGQKILLVNLSKGKLGEMNSKLLGMIFVMKFQAAAMSRVDTPENERKDFCLFVDEFQNFSTESFESILSEARKFRLNLFIANQFMTQLTDKIREAVLGNVGTYIVGRIGVTDAEIMEKVFAPTFKAEDLSKQPNYHAIARVMMYDMQTDPFTMNLLPPIGEENPDVFASLKNYSATKYGRPIAEVEREINERMTVKKPEPKMATEKAEELVNALPGGSGAERKSMLREATDEEEQLLTPKQAGASVQVPKRPNYLDKFKVQPSKEAVEQAEEQLAALERKDKREKDKMHDGDVIKLH